MVTFTATIEKFDKQGEKTGWTYILIPRKIAGELNKGVKKSYRVKGKLDDTPIAQVALVPMGEGDFIMAINAAMRKGLGKRNGATVKVQLEPDKSKIVPPAELIACLQDEPEAYEYFQLRSSRAASRGPQARRVRPFFEAS